jgi:CheY-like chemotaxis protein
VRQAIPAARGETILVVEDETVLLEINATMLRDLGYRVLLAHAPSEAIRLATEHSGDIDLLITDVVMPEMNGRELEQQVRRSNPDIACLYMSGYTANIISHHGVLDKGVHFLQKPFTMNGLAEKVGEALKDKRMNGTPLRRESDAGA